MAKFAKVLESSHPFDLDGVDLFACFDFVDGEGGSLYEFRPKQRTGKVENFDADSPEELARKQSAERADRVNRLAELCTPARLDQLEAEDISVTDLLEKPVFI